MAKFANQLLPPPVAMRSYADPTALGPAESSLIQGFWAAREGVLRCHTPVQYLDVGATADQYGADAVDLNVSGMAWYIDRRETTHTSSHDTASKLLVFYSPLGSIERHKYFEIYDVSSGGTCILYTWDSGAGTLVTDPGIGIVADYVQERVPDQTYKIPQVRYVQQDDTLIFVYGEGSIPRKFWIDKDGTPHCVLLGVPRIQPLDTPFTLSNTEGTDVVMPDSTLQHLPPSTTYDYRVCAADKDGALSDISITVSITTSIDPKNVVLLSISKPDDIESQARLYVARAAQGTSQYYFFTALHVLGTWYEDGYYTWNPTDTTIIIDDAYTETQLVAGTLAPVPGENGLPPIASNIVIHGQRLWLDDRSYGSYPACLARETTSSDYDPDYTKVDAPSTLWCSNLNSFGQFNVVADVNRTDLGGSMRIGDVDYGNISGLMEFGSVLGVWKTTGTWLVAGANVGEFVIYAANNKGCVSADSIGRIKGITYWMAQDGLWCAGSDGTTAYPVSIPVLDYVTRQALPEPTGTYTTFDPALVKGGDLQQGESAVDAVVPLNPQALASSSAWVQDGRYYIAIPDRNVCMCLDPSSPLMETDQAYASTDRPAGVGSGWSVIGFYPVTVCAFREDGWGDRVIVRGTIYDKYTGAEGDLYSQPVFWTGTQMSLDATAWSSAAYSDWTKMVTFGPFDGAAADRSHKKQAVSLTIYGTFRLPDGYAGQAAIGTVSCISDTGRIEKYPITPVFLQGMTASGPQARVMAGGVLWKQRFTPSMKGYVLQAQLEMWVPDVTVSNIMLEYISLDVSPYLQEQQPNA